ncbi:MAG: J domain-containing protein [Isosphaeraceae bacterium]
MPKGVTALPKSRGGRRFRASIRRGKGVEVHLGLYETPWLAGFAYNLAARAIGRGAANPIDLPHREQPTAEEVREITERVRCRLGLDPPSRLLGERPPDSDALLTLFEVTVVGFWRGQAAHDAGDQPGAGLDAAAGRLVEAARLLFWRLEAGHPAPLEVMTELLARRLDATFRRLELTREVLDDDGDDPWRVARWLVTPDAHPGGRLQGFHDQIRDLYAELFEDAPQNQPGSLPAWAVLLGISPPFRLDQVRAAYRAKSRTVHPDAGGLDADFVRLRRAYEDAKEHCSAREH